MAKDEILRIDAYRKTESDLSDQNGVILYIGTLYYFLLHLDMKRFCPAMRLCKVDAIHGSGDRLSAIRYQAIVLDDTAAERDVADLIRSLRQGATVNAITPVRIISPQPAPWVVRLMREFNDVQVISNSDPSDWTDAPRT